MKAGITLLVTAALSLAAASAFAQEPPRPPAPVPPQPGMVPRAMDEVLPQRAIMAPGNPARLLLRHREALALTDEQVKRLEALAEAQQKALQPVGPDRLRALADLWQATSGDVNLDAARAALERLSRLQNDAVLARLRARKEARDVLTPEQRTKLDTMVRAAPLRGSGRAMRRPHAPRPGRWMGPVRGQRRLFRRQL